MVKITIDESRKITLEILVFIDEFCRKNGIDYSLTGGTLLGAVRHKGFIPWDDDIDVFMTRPNYDRFDSAMEKQNEYTWLTRKTNKKFFFNFGRLINNKTKVIDHRLEDPFIDGYGVFVDVCVVDGLPDNVIVRELHTTYIRALYRLRRMAIYNTIPSHPVNRFIKRCMKTFCLTVGIDRWSELIDHAVRRYDFDAGRYVGNVMSQYGKKEIMHKSSFDEYITMEFEGRLFKVIIGWEEYLRNIYGDYMQLPPAEERIGRHPGEIYLIEN